MNRYALFGKKQLFALVFVLVCVGSITAQTHTARTVTINANCLGFYEYLPPNYAVTDQKFPLLIYCGGAGSFGNGSTAQLPRLLTEGIPYYIKNNQFPSSFIVNGTTSSFIVLSPQFVAWPAPADIEAVLDYAATRGYKLDASRIYLTGFSAGGDVSWKYPNTSLVRSQRLAALVPVAGYNYPYVDSGAKYIATANLPVWALHSDSDGPAPSYWSQNFVNKINSFNPAARARITRFSGVTHDQTKLYVYNPTYRVGGLNIYEWMLQYRRNYPPIAKAGNDIALTLPTNATYLNAAGSADPENGPLSYQWSKISGPTAYAISNATGPNPAVTGLVAGQYSFELKVTDNSSLTAKDTVQVVVTNPYPNQLPVAVAGSDLSLTLPQNAVVLSGNGSQDRDGSLESYSWEKIAGPAQYNLVSPASLSTSVTNLAKGTYLFRLSVTDNEGGVGRDTVRVVVISTTPNTPPLVNAGSDQSLTLPTNTTMLRGTATDADGIITSYRWSQVAGPSNATLSNATAATTGVSGLMEGRYGFELWVSDDSGAIKKDTVHILVNKAPAGSAKLIKVNLFGGANPFTQEGWNNWNVTGETNITSANFAYSDGTPSVVSSVLSYSQGVPDNGSTYGGSMCPPPVLRYTSYTTASSRTLTIRGLNSSLRYDVEFYASRLTTGNSTRFVVNGLTRTVVTDNNKTEKAVFTDLAPTNGQLVVSLQKIGTFSYLNGFTLTEKAAAASGLRIAHPATSLASDTITTESGAEPVVLLPNPFHTRFQVRLHNPYRGKLMLSLLDLQGRVVKQEVRIKSGEQYAEVIEAAHLPPGMYLLRVSMGGKQWIQKLVKEN